jgi:hypothetical protein
MSRTTYSHTTFGSDAIAEPFAHDLIGSGAWIIALVIATIVVYLEFRKSAARGKLALVLLMITGFMIILLPPFGSLILLLTMFAIIVMSIEHMNQ